MNYQEFLFSQLFMYYVDNYKTNYNTEQKTYDQIYPEVVKHHKKFLKSTQNNFNLSLYECILLYLIDNL